MSSRKFCNIFLIYGKEILSKVFLLLLLCFPEAFAKNLQKQLNNSNNNVKNHGFYLKVNNGPFSYKIIEEQHYLKMNTDHLFSWFTSKPIPSQEYNIKVFTNATDISLALGYYNTFLSQNRIRSDLELKLTHTISEKQEINDTNFTSKGILNGYYDVNTYLIKDLKIYFGFGIGVAITKDWFQKTQQNNNQDLKYMWITQKMVGLEYQLTDKISISGEYKNYTDYKININANIKEYFNGTGIHMMNGKGALIGLRYNF